MLGFSLNGFNFGSLGKEAFDICQYTTLYVEEPNEDGYAEIYYGLVMKSDAEYYPDSCNDAFVFGEQEVFLDESRYGSYDDDYAFDGRLLAEDYLPDYPEDAVYEWVMDSACCEMYRIWDQRGTSTSYTLRQLIAMYLDGEMADRYDEVEEYAKANRWGFDYSSGPVRFV